MSEYSKLASESMKNLTERVIKADLSQRKGRMLQAKAMSIVSLIYVPFGLYFGYHLLFPKGRWHDLNSQSGDQHNIYKVLMFKQSVYFRQLYRPEIYHHHEFQNLMEFVKVTQMEVGKNENIKFKPYVWH